MRALSHLRRQLRRQDAPPRARDAMRLLLDPERMAAHGVTPGDVQAALQRNNYLAAVGQTKGNLVQVNLLANTDLRTVKEFEDLIVADRGGGGGAASILGYAHHRSP